MGEAKIGTTGRGIGPAYEDKIARRAIRLSGSLLSRPLRRPSSSALLEFHNFVLVQYFQARAGGVREDARRDARARRRAATDGGRRRRAAAGGAPPRRFAAVRRRAGRAARHRSRNVSVRDVVELPRRRGGAGCRRRPRLPRLRARDREGVRDARRHGPVPDRAHRRNRRAAREARQRIRLGDRPAAAMRVARHRRARALVRAERRDGHVHHQARRAGRTCRRYASARATRYAVSRSAAAADRAPMPLPSAIRCTKRCPAGRRARSA